MREITYRSLHLFMTVVLGILTAPDPAGADSAGRLRCPSTGVPDEWLTKAEQTAFQETPRYDETVRFCQRLGAASSSIDCRSFGVSPQGRELVLVIASKGGVFTPHEARADGRLIVLVQNCIHAGECAGKDASLMLLRDIAITETRKGLLDHVVLLTVPIFSVDGHERFSPYSRINQNGPTEMGWRVTSRNLNLNRDYIKADAAEMRAWLSLWNAWRPDLHFDNHTTDGGDWQYDLMYAADTSPAAAPPVARWLENVLFAQLNPALESDGHVPAVFFGLIDSKDPSKGIRSGPFSPRFSTGYVSIRNRPSILVETHMLKPYRTRVIAHYNIMLRTLELLNRDPDSLREATQAADESTVKLGKEYDPDRTLPLTVGRSDDSVPFSFKGHAYRRELSDVSGDVRIVYDDTKPIEIDTVWHNGTKVDKTVNPPLAYIIPSQWTEVIDLVKAHGLRSERLSKQITTEVESYRFSDVSFADRPYEGRFRARLQTEMIVERRTFPAGSVVVPLDQPDAKVAIHMLEPDAPDSLASWGFFNAVFEQKEYAEHYILEDLARRMLQADPTLREEFESKIRSDRSFASSPRSRLYFFYKRSPYWDASINVYPIARLTSTITSTTAPADPGQPDRARTGP